MKEGSQISAAKYDYPNRKFTLKKKLGEGAQRFVYFAVATFWGNNSNKELVLKFSPKESVKEQEYNFIKQLMDYQSSKNEESFPSNIIRVLDNFEYQNYFVTVMEKGEQDLYTYLGQNRYRITNREKTKICLDVVMPIYFLHSNRLVHRDIKPENYIKVGDKFKLFDFGLVKKIDRQQDFNMTKDVGKILFQAPEMIDDISNYTHKVDVWSLGCLFCEIFNPNPLFDANSFEQVKQLILNHKDNPKFVNDKIDRLNCDLPMKNLMKQMLQFDQDKRFNIQQVLEQLQNILPKYLNYQISQIQIQPSNQPQQPINAQSQRQQIQEQQPPPQQPLLNETILNEKLLEIEKKFDQKLEEQKLQLILQNVFQLKLLEDKIQYQQTQIEQYQKKQKNLQNIQKQDIQKELQEFTIFQPKLPSGFRQFSLQQQKVQFIDPIQDIEKEDNQQLEQITKQLLQQQEQFTKSKQEVDQQLAKVQQQIEQISNQLTFTIQKPSEPDKVKEQQNQLFIVEMEKIKQLSEEYQNQQQQNNYYNQQIQQFQEFYNQQLAYQKALYQEIQQMKEDQTNADPIKKQQQETQQINSKLDELIKNQNTEIQNQIRKLNLETLKKQLKSLEDTSKQVKQEIDEMKKLKPDSQLLDLKESISQQQQLYLTQQEQQNQIKSELNQLNDRINIHQKQFSENEDLYKQTLESLKMNDQNIIIEKGKVQIFQQINLFVQELCEALKKQIYQDFALLEQKIDQKVNYAQVQELKDSIVEINKKIKSEIPSCQIQSKKSVKINDQELLQFKLNQVQQDYQNCQQKLINQESMIFNQNQQINELQNIVNEREKQLHEQAEQNQKLSLEIIQLQEQLQKNIQEKNSVILDLYTSSKEISKLKQEIQELQQQFENIKPK